MPRVLLVASTGGHLEELYQLRPSLVGPEVPVTWLTFDTPQSRSLLADEADVVYVPRVGTRGYRALLGGFVRAFGVLRRVRPSEVYSTGAGVALAYLPLAWIVRARACYIESAARTAGPSVTGRLLSLLPWVRTRTQYQHWAGRRWHYAGSVFDGFVARPAPDAGSVAILVVTLGTQEGYPFVRLVERINAIRPAGVEVRWQVGSDFPLAQRPEGARDVLGVDEMDSWVAAADAVVAHAGVGSALRLLHDGVTPVLVPRSARHGEHVDDHQALIGHELMTRGLAIVVPVEELTWEHIVESTRTAAARA